MSSFSILLIIGSYFLTLLLISYFIGKKHSNDQAFFLGNKKSPWFVVAFGMIGSSISGVTFVSVPGMVRNFDMTYMQMVFGFLLGYLLIAHVLLPLYYKMNLVSIYTYLEKRIGKYGYKTGAAFFLLARTIGSAARLYVAALVLQNYVFDEWNIPFWLTASAFLLMIWLYTFQGGIRTIVWTDILQTSCLLIALVLIIYQVSDKLGLDLQGIVATIRESEHSRMFVFGDWVDKQNFFKQFLSGVFVTIAMTGVDQEMMQKNLSCRTLKDAQKNMYWYGFSFVPVNFLFLCLGILLLTFASTCQISLPALGDDILPSLASEGYLGRASLVFFIIGIIAVTFSSSDSALTGLTTSFCIDMLNTSQYPEKKAKRIRMSVHFLLSALFVVIILLFKALNNTSIIDAIYTIAAYTYGPLLGLFIFGLITKVRTRDKWVPFVCVLAPVLCFALDRILFFQTGYKFGYEMLIVNAGLVVLGLYLLRIKER